MNSKTVKIVASLSLLLVLGFAISCIKKTIPIAPPVPPSVTLKDGLLLYLPFNGTIADSSGNNNTVALIDSSGPVFTTDENGHSNSAFYANGTGQWLQVTNNGSIKFDSAFTLSFNFLVNFVSAYQRQTFVTMVNTTDAYGPTFAAGLSIPGMTNFCFGVDDSTAGCDNTNGFWPADVADTSTFTPAASTWYNVVCIYKKGTVTEYVNGQFVGSKTNSLGNTALLCPASTVNIGMWWVSDQEALYGSVDEVRLYNRTLTLTEINSLAGKNQ
jgi:concanavalin A-like lectin/glucanase superfamily protein